jgi:hypothetical protein
MSKGRINSSDEECWNLKIEFKNQDGGDTIHYLEKEGEELKQFITILNTVDEINIFVDEGYYLHGKDISTMYEVNYESGEPEETLMVFIG